MPNNKVSSSLQNKDGLLHILSLPEYVDFWNINYKLNSSGLNIEQSKSLWFVYTEHPVNSQYFMSEYFC